jgi:hypothetical protein
MPKLAIAEAERLRKKGGQLVKDRDSSWLAKWKNMRDFLAPNDGQFEGDRPNDGERRDRKMNNKRPMRSAQIAAAGMASGMASQARPWFALSAPNGVQESAAIDRWLYEVADAIRLVLSKSNLYNILPQVFHSQAVYGTAAMSALPDDEDVIRFHHYPVGTFALDTSARGVVDTFYREYTMTPRQMAQQFGKDNLSVNVKNAAERGELTPIKVCHLIEPNPDADMQRVDNAAMPWRSTYWEKGGNDGMVLRQSGFSAFPIMAPRWDVNGVNVYGTGPGDVALGKSRELQLLEADKLRVVQQYARPAVTAPLSMRGQAASLVPGGIAWVPDNLVGQSFQPAYTPDPNILPNLRSEINECIAAIAEAFFEDLFLLISQSEGTMTAYEVSQRKEEKMLMLGPVVERNNDELFDPLMNQVFAVMLEQSMPRWMGLLPGVPLIPPPPEELAGVPLTVEYVSILAQAQKSVAAGSIERALQFTSMLVQSGVQNAFDAIDTDEAQKGYYEAIGAPPIMLRDAKQVEAIRQGRAAALQQQQQSEQAMAMVQGAKTLSETPTGGDTALSALTGAM